MKRLAFLLLTTVAASGVQAQLSPKVQTLLSRMTLDEKIGQMTQVTLGVVSSPQDGIMDSGLLANAVEKYKVGSILNVTNHALSVDQWRKVIRQIQDDAAKTRLKIPVIYGLDGIHGQTYTLNATLFPQNIAMAATRDPDLAAAIAKVAA